MAFSYLEMQRDEREYKGLKILHQVVEDTQPFWVGRLGHIDEGSNLSSLTTANQQQYSNGLREEGNTPRSLCDRCPTLFLTLAFHPCSSLATWNRPLCEGISARYCRSFSDEEYFMISLSLTIRLISLIRRELTHTITC